MKEAKEAKDLKRYCELAKESPSVRKRLALVNELQSQNKSVSHLDPVSVLADHPELVAGCATNCSFTHGIMYIEVKGASANIARAAAEDASKLRRLVYPKDKTPQYSVRLALRPIGGEFSDKARKSRKLDNFSHVNDEKFEHTIDIGKQLNAFRKAVQGQYTVGVTQRQRELSVPDLPLTTVLSVLEEHVTDGELKATIKGMLDGSLEGMTEEDVQVAIRAIRGGTFYMKFRSSVAAWWWDAMIELGFGHSGTSFPFNPDLFWEMVAMAENEVDFILRFVLAWAGYDGSVLAQGFEVIVPADEGPSSIKALFHYIFDKYLGVQTGVDNERLAKSEVENGKDIIYIRITKKKEKRQLATKLLPIAEKWRLNPQRNYLSYDRFENLVNYLK